MADPLPSFWRLDDFDAMYATWLKIDNPSEELQTRVLHWLAARADDPYNGGLKRDFEMPFLYHGPIPGTRTPDGKFVYCSYFIYAETRIVKCNALTNLAPPFLSSPAPVPKVSIACA